MGKNTVYQQSFPHSCNIFVKPGFYKIHQDNKARLSSDKPGQEGGGRIDLDRPFLTSTSLNAVI